MTERKTKAKLQRTLKLTFDNLLKPERVKKVRITYAGKGVILGFLLAHCPVEDHDQWEDFEAHVANDRSGSIKYAIVDGRRLAPRSSGRWQGAE